MKPRPEGEVIGWKSVTREEGGKLTVTCGGCGIVREVEVEPDAAHRTVNVIANRALARAGFIFSPVYGWIERECAKVARREARRGFVQLSIF